LRPNIDRTAERILEEADWEWDEYEWRYWRRGELDPEAGCWVRLPEFISYQDLVKNGLIPRDPSLQLARVFETLSSALGILWRHKSRLSRSRERALNQLRELEREGAAQSLPGSEVAYETADPTLGDKEGGQS